MGTKTKKTVIIIFSIVVLATLIYFAIGPDFFKSYFEDFKTMQNMKTK